MHEEQYWRLDLYNASVQEILKNDCSKMQQE